MESQRPDQPRNEPELGMCGCDRDIFLRVWRRVAPEDRPDCPITVEQDAQPAQTAVDNNAVESAASRQISPDSAGDDFPTADDVPCLGSAAAHDRERLQEFIDRELTLWRSYQALARRVNGPGGRVVSSLAGDVRKRAKRLSAALFLISGVRFWPQEQRMAPAPRSYLGALREHFLTEQNLACAYRAAAEDCRDACLRALYLELAAECGENAGRIRGLLESM